MDKKCERCFLKYWVSAPDSIDPAIGKWYCVISGKWCSATGLECKLTDDNIISFGAAILQAIAGEGRLTLTKKGGASYNLITGEITTSDGRVL